MKVGIEEALNLMPEYFAAGMAVSCIVVTAVSVVVSGFKALTKLIGR